MAEGQLRARERAERDVEETTGERFDALLWCLCKSLQLRQGFSR